MELYRSAYRYLENWKSSSNRKPLIIRGARQVGKTTLVRQFSREFDHFIELNLERDSDNACFASREVNTILNTIYLLKNKSISKGSIMLFIDEIQESPEAISMLRYFYEERPDIFLIAAGSLLEFTLKSVPAFPVGRVSYLYLSPLNFEEYLKALNHSTAIEAMSILPVPGYAHSTLLSLFHEYALIGGMPEAVAAFIKEKNIGMVTPVYKSLWRAYKDDFEKYAGNDSEGNILRHVLESAPFAADRISFEGFGQSSYRSREVGEALRALDLANIIRLIYPTTALIPPIAADRKKRPKLQFLDTGLLNNSLAVQSEILNLTDLNNVHRGRIAQHLVIQQLISIETSDRYQPHFWVKEEKDSNAEVDLVFQYGKYVVPIEIKSGKQGKLRSLHQFVERADHPYAVRMHAGDFSVEKVKTPAGKAYLLMNMPYFLATRLPEYIQYFLNNYTM